MKIFDAIIASLRRKIMIEETLSKFEGKPLSKYITLLTGFPLFMWGLNEFGNISVKTDYFDFINLDSNSTPQFLSIYYWL